MVSEYHNKGGACYSDFFHMTIIMCTDLQIISLYHNAFRDNLLLKYLTT